MMPTTDVRKFTPLEVLKILEHYREKAYEPLDLDYKLAEHSKAGVTLLLDNDGLCEERDGARMEVEAQPVVVEFYGLQTDKLLVALEVGGLDLETIIAFVGLPPGLGEYA